VPPAKKSRQSEAADAVKSAVDQTFQATLGARGRASELVDELTTAAGRVRDALEDVRIVTGDEVNELRDQVRKLERRVAALEDKPKRSSARSSSAKAKPKSKAKPKKG
jgi:phage shock protein A